jgi:hypothetical protein
MFNYHSQSIDKGLSPQLHAFEESRQLDGPGFESVKALKKRVAEQASHIAKCEEYIKHAQNKM